MRAKPKKTWSKGRKKQFWRRKAARQNRDRPSPESTLARFMHSMESMFAELGEPPPAPAPPDPATETRDEVEEAGAQKRRQNKRRRGYHTKRFAGETGGFQLGGSAGKATLGA